MSKQKTKKWYQKMPSTYVILFLIVVAAAALTWILPAGEYERVLMEGVNRPTVIPGS